MENTSKTEYPSYNLQILKFSEPQPGVKDRKNEDVIHIQTSGSIVCFSLMDGASSMSDITTAKPTVMNGCWAASTATKGIEYAFPDSSKLLIKFANLQVAKEALAMGIDVEKVPSRDLATSSGATVGVIDTKKGTVEISQVGDTIPILVNRKGVASALFPIDNCIEDSEAYFLAKNIAVIKGIPIQLACKDKEVAEILLKGRNKENVPDGSGYGAINGKSSLEKYIRTKTLSLDEVKQIIVMSDGFLPPTTDFFGALDLQTIVSELHDLRPSRFYKEKVFKLKEQDKDLQKYPRLKMHDDASVIIINFNS